MPATAEYAPRAEISASGGEVSLAPGQRFGGYRVVRRLGSGGMGTVYEADQLESGRRVALKVLSHGFDSPDARKRFLREGRLAASVNHPNSVYVFGAEDVGGIPVIAMELMSGGTLEERVRESGPMRVGEAVDAILQVIDGLEAAEAGGVLHRDVKPANCFVDRDGTVKVGDFGLSISSSLRGDSNLTTDGTFLGTPAFSSPEQLRGDDLDVRSDIYAVGVTLYYLLTGQMPFRADNMIRLIAAVLEGSPASPVELRASIPKGLAQAVLRCLNKQPAARFSKYDELRRALLPFSSAAPAPEPLRLRLVAGVIDHFLLHWSTLAFALSLGWFQALPGLSCPNPYISSDYFRLSAVICVLYVLYFGVSEGVWGASLGKAICRLRVLDARRNVAGVARATVRAAVYVVFPQLVTVVCLAFASTRATSISAAWPMRWLESLWLVVLALMFSTARRQNGYAAFHGLLSGTRVVRKPAREMRPLLLGGEEPPEDTAAMPTVGPYHVLDKLEKADGQELLLGYDTRLSRKVWIRTFSEDEPAVAAEVQELARPGRLRWLAGRRLPGECWDAYEAPSGSPLVSLLDRRQPWESVRHWLVDLAEELGAGLRGRSLPDVLALDRVWITSEGRAKLLDFPAPGVDRRSRWCNLPRLAGADPAATRLFLIQVAVAALEGQAIGPEEARRRPVAVPLPLRAREVLERLATAEAPETLPRRLRPLPGSTPSVTRLRRLGLLAGCLALPIFFSAVIVLVSLTEHWWTDEDPEVVTVRYCLARLERLDVAADPVTEFLPFWPGEREELQVYVAGHFADRGAWSGLLDKVFFSRRQRRIAQEALAKYPNVSERRLADATAVLQACRRAMPEGRSGIATLEEEMVAMVFSGVLGLFFVAIPSVTCALLFRGGPLMYFLGIAVVTGDGSRASRPRTFWRALITWSPCLLIPLLLAILVQVLTITWAVPIVAAATLAVVAWSALLPERGIPDRIAGTYPVPR